jgi:hypothetical protein
MAKSKMLDRITVSFYEEVDIEVVLLKALNKISAPRLRGAKLKEWAYNYLRSDTELFNQVMKDIQGNNTEVDLSKNIKQNKIFKKEKLKNNFNIVTSD